VLTKETGILLPLSLLVIEGGIGLIKRHLTRISLYSVMAALTACVAYGGWSWYLYYVGQTSWSDWIFSETASRGATFTIIHNITTGAFINAYAIQHWLHLFVLNYMWIYTSLALVSVVYWLISGHAKHFSEQLNSYYSRALMVYILFGGLYTFLVLTFQTYTIPRYVLPVVPLILLLTSWTLSMVMHLWPRTMGFIVVAWLYIGIVSLYASWDPVSSYVWGEDRWMGQKIYNLKDHLAGNDGIAYNLQYLTIMKKRTEKLQTSQITGEPIVSADCSQLFPDTNNEVKMLSILALDNVPRDPWCVAP
jgi:hypothetical protein